MQKRRDFIKTSLAGGVGLAFLFHQDDPAMAVETSTQNVNRQSGPSDLKITDLRIAWTSKTPIIKIDTNQGIYGLGDVRDAGDPRWALMLKSRLLGKNPCHVEGVFRLLKQFGTHGRGAGGVSGVEMALWDLCGKAWGVPVYQLLGGKYRDKIRIYADTPMSSDIQVLTQRIKSRLEKGYTFLKMDFGIELAKEKGIPIVNGDFHELHHQYRLGDVASYGWLKHPFTRIELTDEALDHLCGIIEEVRSVVGYQIPLASDHYGHFDHNNAIRLGKAVEKYRLAWLEDLIPWFYTDHWRMISDAIDTPTMTGEDIFSKEEFRKLVDAKAVDMIHPDLATAGGCLETKKIGDYAEESGIPMALHCAGSPITFMASVHCAAATYNTIALEHHDIDNPHWESMVTMNHPMIENGFANVPDSPGLGIDLNEEVIRSLLLPGEEYFPPSDQWNSSNNWDRPWS